MHIVCFTWGGPIHVIYFRRRRRIVESMTTTTQSQARPLNEMDIELIMNHTQCSRSDAIARLLEHGGDIINVCLAYAHGWDEPVPHESRAPRNNAHARSHKSRGLHPITTFPDWD